MTRGVNGRLREGRVVPGEPAQHPTSDKNSVARAQSRTCTTMTTALTPTATRPSAALGGGPRRVRGPRAAADGCSNPSRTRGVDATPIPTVPRRAALTALTAAAASSRDLSPATASVASTSEVVREAAALATNGAGASTVAFDDATVTIRGTGQVVPVAVWYPTDGTGPTPTYPHAISVAKIARVLLNTPKSTPRFLDRDFPLEPSAGVVRASSSDAAPKNATGAVVLCHGYLGSRFDLVDLAEALAASGFVVAAPEFAESLASPDTVSAQTRPGAKPAANPSATRETVLNATLKIFDDGKFAWVDGDGERRSKAPVALVGQSAGASTATGAPGSFAARVAIAGFRPPPSEEREKVLTLLGDPLLVVASAGDGVISLYPTDGGVFGPYRGIEAEVASLPAEFARFDAGGLLDSVRSRDARRTAFVTYETGGGGTPGSTPGQQLPCHISFLSSRTNDAMVDVLGPLLPVARLLGVPVLDFDRYEVTRDSDEVNETLVPAVTAWLAAVMR